MFYLILRGLDTIEDDMTIAVATKVPLLRNFHVYLRQSGWTFDGNGPKEKDRQLLVEFDVVCICIMVGVSAVVRHVMMMDE